MGCGYSSAAHSSPIMASPAVAATLAHARKPSNRSVGSLPTLPTENSTPLVQPRVPQVRFAQPQPPAPTPPPGGPAPCMCFMHTCDDDMKRALNTLCLCTHEVSLFRYPNKRPSPPQPLLLRACAACMRTKSAFDTLWLYTHWPSL